MLRIVLPPEGGPVLDLVAEVLRAGKVAVVPSDTLYGFSACYDQPGAIQRIADLKGRGGEEPFLLLVGSSDQLACLTSSPPAAAVAEMVWPGAVTLLLPGRPDLAPQLRGPRGTVAVRWPSDRLLNELLARVKAPIVSTSVNRRGEPSLGDPDQIERSFGGAIDLLADAGPRQDLVPSTIVDLTRRPPVVVRQGTVRLDVDRLDELLSRGHS
jgi:tRNA threonylcarbamoyl adenosine modification protein (Sua5/YciO/YrdC/YwlC family)